MKHLRRIGLAVAGGLVLAVPAKADPAAWSSSANGCVATSTSINEERYATSAYVTHRGTNVDPITLYCPVTYPPAVSIGYNLEVTYLDSTGTGTGANVLVRLFKQSRTTGASTPIASFNSNTQASTTVNLGAVTFVPGFDFAAYVYFVQIVMDRSSTSQTVRVYSVAIVPTMV